MRAGTTGYHGWCLAVDSVCQKLPSVANTALQSFIRMTYLRLCSQLMFFFLCPLCYPFLSSCSHANLPPHFLFSPFYHTAFSQSLSPLSLFHTFLSPSALFPRHPPSWFYLCFLLSHSSFSLLIYLYTPPPSRSASLAGCSLQWVSIMEAGSGAAAAVGSAALGLLGATATSSHDILDR